MLHSKIDNYGENVGTENYLFTALNFLYEFSKTLENYVIYFYKSSCPAR